jgi:poly(3-hydroxybutyrate) depolymerase
MPDQPRSERSELYFGSGDARCHGWLYMPDGTSSDARPPIIMMGHGLGAVKTLRLSAFAERFQAKPTPA